MICHSAQFITSTTARKQDCRLRWYSLMALHFTCRLTFASFRSYSSTLKSNGRISALNEFTDDPSDLGVNGREEDRIINDHGTLNIVKKTKKKKKYVTFIGAGSSAQSNSTILKQTFSLSQTKSISTNCLKRQRFAGDTELSERYFTLCCGLFSPRLWSS